MQPGDSPLSANAEFLIKETGRCVACGLCLPHCPTYRQTLSEADSPRGRIALVRAVAEQRLPLNRRFAEHIDLCLTCRACENACANHVRFGAIVDGVRPAVEAARSRPRWQKWLRRLAFNFVSHPRRLERLGPMLRGYRRSGMRQLMSRALDGTLLEAAEQLLPRLPAPVRWKNYYPALGIPQGEVALFLGCAARLLDVETLRSAVYVLTRLGYGVRVPGSQTCCGALHRHAGDPAGADALAERNRQAFRDASVVIAAASGCGAELGEYGEHGTALAVQDVSEFLVGASGWDRVELAPLDATVAVHDPCTLRNVMHRASDSYRLLERIPGTVVEPLAGNEHCCGAAGTYFLTQPEMARALREEKISAVRATKARYLATSNFGCAMHLTAGLAGVDIEAVHPVTLLARQMGFRHDRD